MEAIQKLQDQVLFGNSVLTWVTAAGVTIAISLVGLVIRAVFRSRIQRLAALTSSTFDDFVVRVLGETKFVSMLAVGTLGGLGVLQLSPRTESICRGLIVAVVLLQAGIWGSKALAELVRRRFEGSDPDGTPRSGGGLISAVGRVVLWSVLLVIALDNFGINVTALVAGLGVGGIAVALAAQNVLGDLFASVSILLDKPFVIGDFIVVGDFLGSVERIGIKTTRIRSLAGEELVFSNADLLQSRLRNYKRMVERRIAFSVGVVYQTDVDTLEKIPAILRECVEAEKDTRFDRAHFKSFGDFALNFEIVYYVTVADYNRYMDIQQAINLGIARRFAATNIEFAYPTQTLFVAQVGGVAKSGAKS